MVCIYCDSNKKTKVVNSRSSIRSHSTWRRRQCLDCSAIFTSREEIELSSALRVSTSNGLTAFSRDHLLLGVYRSVSHRKSAINDASELTDTIITTLTPLNADGVLNTAQISSEAQTIIARFDTAAGVSYRAHHIKN